MRTETENRLVDRGDLEQGGQFHEPRLLTVPLSHFKKVLSAVVSREEWIIFSATTPGTTWWKKSASDRVARVAKAASVKRRFQGFRMRAIIRSVISDCQTPPL